MRKPQAEPGEICPLHRRDVSKVCHKCPLYIKLMGTHPQTGNPVEEWGCSLAFMPMLMVENSQQQRQTGAAVESFRNEMADATRQQTQAILLTAVSDPKLIEN